ncbi:MAG: 2-hydroxyacid dehydrogenase [Lachnospiraceae bacterium]|jgi:D-3-phosphoglycerate dehydrogenase|nr:2-hydroxyacid dehydrogenase [Lachnospiraceae bacterium]
MKLLVTTYMESPYFEEFRGMFDTIVYKGMMKIGRVLTEEEMCEAIKGCDAVVAEFDPITAKVLEAADNLKVIASPRGGAHANVDVKKATELGIPILFVPGRNQDTVADFTIGLMIAVSRHLAQGNHLIKNGVITDEKPYNENGFCVTDVNWVGSTPEKFAYLQFKGPTLSGKKLGLVGYGAIGRETAKRALAFDMEVVAFDPFVKQETVTQNVKLVDLAELMSTSDFVSVHLPVNDGTRGIVSVQMLSLMKPTAYMINTARAAVMDYDKLITMLKNKEIAGAGLDVYPIEPLPADHPLLSLDNVVLTPHIAGCSYDPYDRSYQVLAEDLKLFFAGKKPVHLYNPDVWKD